jgi:hypothetical protein
MGEGSATRAAADDDDVELLDDREPLADIWRTPPRLGGFRTVALKTAALQAPGHKSLLVLFFRKERPLQLIVSAKSSRPISIRRISLVPAPIS